MSIRLKKLRSLINIDLNNVLVVGICGIGGIGKTTIAKALYNVISYKFEGVSFLANVRENSKDDVGLLRLQQQLLDDIRKRKNQQISNVHEGMDAIKKVLSLKRVLVVLDDVDNCKQVENLVGKRDCFVRGSRILITTRDRHPLDAYGADKPYHEIEELNSEEALQLFSLYAFKPNCHQEDYEDLSNHIVKYAKGLPLVLRVLGSHLCERTPNQWKSELHKLEREPVQDIQNVLKISYNGLDRTQGEIFLDIACFFKGQDKDFVSRILDGCDLYAESGFSVLCDRSLITILDNKIHMHDLIQQMGWHIVREQYPKEPGKWSRLWEPKDVFHVLTRNTGTKAIEGIFLDMSTSKQLQFTTKAFKRMKMLRLLKVHRDAKYDSIVNSLTPVEPSKVLLSQEHFCRDFEFPSQELRYLHWDGYPMESLPSNFYAENLVELNLRCSNIKQLWETELLEKLKVIDLSHCQHLNKIPNPSSVPNLEILTLKGWCINLETLPENMGNMENLRQLYLNYTAILNLPSSIEHLKGLEYLSLEWCDNLITVPQSIFNLTALKFLSFSCCSKLEKLPEDLKSLKRLETLSLHGLNCQLPSVSGLCSLRELYLKWIMGENMGNHVTIDLPQDWYEDKDFLGFALCSAYVPPDDQSGNGSAYKFDSKSKDEDQSPCSLHCNLTFHGDQSAFSIYPSLSSLCECCENDGASGQVWVLYYPKFAIEEKYHSNKWGRLKASFHGYFNGMPMKVEKCGMQLIYAKNDEYNRPTLIQHNDSSRPLIRYMYSRRGRKSVLPPGS
ncbi:TMV resistance protein N [Vitis vinifera]|uniref:TMV resistance protein N n=1 Tax=Vitis vinifera TaxID=29760 RepID=A0A438JVX2_VITVI|nr:TMV resistance protein N [Vitis vinifera]